MGKHNKAHEEMPLNFKTKFRFDIKTPEGKKAFEKFKNHLEKGTDVEIEGKYIESFDVPDFLPDWMKPKLTEDAKLIFKQHRSGYIIPLRIERRLPSGEVISSDRLDFEVTQQGTTEITLKNDRQKVPLQITITLDSDKSSFRFDVTYQYSGFNVFEHLQHLKLFDSMTKDGETSIYRVDTGSKIVDADKRKVNVKDKFDKDIQLLEALYLIQQKIPILLSISDYYFTGEDIEDIFEITQIIKNGKLTAKITDDFKVLVPLETARETIKIFENEIISGVLLSYSDGYKFEILGNEIDLGKAVIVTDAFIIKENFEMAERQIEAKEELVEFSLTPKEKSVIIDFLNWDCEDRHTRLQITEPEIKTLN